MSNKYLTIWEKVKEKNRCVIKCAPEVVNDIRVAVTKEKFKDAAFRVLNDHDKLYLKITHNPKDGTLTFLLKARYGIEDIKNERHDERKNVSAKKE